MLLVWLPGLVRGADPVSVIRRPILNVPAILRAGDNFDILCRASSSTSGWAAYLMAEGVERGLILQSQSYDAGEGRWTLQVQVPRTATPELYSLRVSAAGVADTTANAVRVVASYPNRFYIAHITDSHIPNRSAIDFDTAPELRRIGEELEIINPAFVVHTGDLVEEASSESYFSQAQELISEIDLPVYIAAGGHDLQIFHSRTLDREWWNKYFGDITDYTFKFGDNFFGVLEEYELPTPNFTQQQIQWISGELQNSIDDGDPFRGLFYHYDNGLDISASFVDVNQVDLVLYGHIHAAREEMLGSSTHVYATAPTMDGGYGQFNYEGNFRIIEVVEGQVVSAPVLAYGGLSLTYSPVNDGSNPYVAALVSNDNDLAFPDGEVRFYVPRSQMPYTVTGGAVRFHRPVSGSAEMYSVQVEIPAQGNVEVVIQPSSGVSNYPPVIDSFSPEGAPGVFAGGALDFSVSASDRDGDPLSYRWFLDDAETGSAGVSYTYRPGASDEGGHTVGVRVSDGQFYDFHEWDVNILPKTVTYTIQVNVFGLLSPNDSILVTWEELVPASCYLHVGPSPGTYSLATVAEHGSSRKASLWPASAGIDRPGIYYAIVTDSPVSDPQTATNYSPEFRLIIEAQHTAEVLSPRGAISEAMPVIEWIPVDGVPYYHVIVSDEPAIITADENGEMIVEGANVIWQAITPNLSIQYGAPDPSGYFEYVNGTPPPLMSGVTYNYLVLNNYRNHPAFTSTIQGGVIEFTVDVESALDPPELLRPSDDVNIQDETITFRWSAVDGAINYKVVVLEQRKEGGSTISFAVWDEITSATVADCPASAYLVHAEYVWKVIAWDAQGGGVQSEVRNFVYAVDVGTLEVTTYNDQGAILPRVMVATRPVQGTTDIVPIVTDDSGWGQRHLVPGSYRLTASREGYEDEVLEVDVDVDPNTDDPEGNTFVAINLTESPARISGLVLDSDTGRPLEDASVRLTDVATGSERETRTDATGYFLAGLSSGTWDLKVYRDAYITSDALRLNISPGESRDLSGSPIQLVANSGTLSGVVTSPGGSPIRGVDVLAVVGSDTSKTISSESGSFRMAVVPGSYEVTAGKPGFFLAESKDAVISRGGNVEVVLTLLPNANLVSGYVREGSIALGGAEVRASPLTGTPTVVSSTPTGQFSFSLGSGTYDISAVKEGYVPSDATQITVNVGETVSGLQIALTPSPSAIQGRITSDGTTGLAGAEISAGAVETSTDEQGNYTLNLGAGSHTLLATKEGYAASSPYQVTIAAGQTLRGVDFTLSPNAATVDGRVMSQGATVAGTTIIFAAGQDSVHVNTENNGSYSISLAPKQWTARARKTGFLDSQPRSLNLGPGQTISGIDFEVVPATALVSGTVTDGVDPLRNATITARDRSGAGEPIETSTNAEGRYNLALLAGHNYDLVVQKEGHDSQGAAVDSPAPGSTLTINFQMTRLPSSVSGNVTSSSGAALSGCRVAASGDSTTTDSDGNFKLFLAAGSHALSAQIAGHNTGERNISLNPGQHLTGVSFVLDEEFAAVSGNVTSDSAGLADVLIQLAGPDGQGATTRSDASGYYRVTRLLPGPYTVNASLAEYLPASATPTLRPRENLELDIQMTRALGRFYGTVTDGVAGVEGATVTAESEGISYTGVTDAQGNYEISGLPMSTYAVRGAKSGHTSPAPLSGLSPDDRQVDLTLIPNRSILHGTVLADGMGLGDVLVQAQGNSGGFGQATSDPQGAYRMEALPPDTYVLTATRSGYSQTSGSDPVALGTDETRRADIGMTGNTLKLSGTVTDGASLMAGVLVEAASNTERQSATTGDQGGFSFSGLAGNTDYRISTLVLQKGLIDADSTIHMGAADFTDLVLTLGVARAAIAGICGLEGVSVSAIHSDGETRMAQTDAQGGYEIVNMRGGAYEVRAEKPGYIADPLRVSVTLGSEEQRQVDFQMAANLGEVAGTVTAEGGGELEGVSMNLVGDAGFATQGATGADGGFLFEEVPAGATYTVTPNLEDYAANPASREVAVTRGQRATADFTMIEGSATVAGSARLAGSGDAVAGVSLSLLRSESGQLFTGQTDDAGQFVFDKLAPGSFEFRASKAGYQVSPADSNFTLAAGGSVSIDLALVARTGRIHGYVRHRGRGLDAVTVLARGARDYQATTDASGEFSFPDLPPDKHGVGIDLEDFPSIAFSNIGVEVGSSVRVPMDIPSASLHWAFSDGVEPLEGVVVRLTGPSSQPVAVYEAGKELFRGQIQAPSEDPLILVSNARGRARTDSVLLAGEYEYILELENSIPPAPSHRRFDLASEQALELSVPMPFYHESVRIAQARVDTRILITTPAGLGVDNFTNMCLHWRGLDQTEFEKVEMEATEGGFLGMLPPQPRSGTAAYFITGQYGSLEYESPVTEVEVSSQGVLNTLTVSPSEGIIQNGVTTELVLTVTDDGAVDLTDALAKSGAVAWELVDSSPGDQLAPDTAHSARAFLTPAEPGMIKVKTTATLNGVSLSEQVTLESRNLTLGQIQVFGPKRMSNQTSRQFTYQALSEDSILMRIQVGWSVSPEGAGTVTEDGLFTASDGYLGDATVQATEIQTDMTQDFPVNIYAVIDSAGSYSLTDAQGMLLQVPVGSVDRRQELSLYKPALSRVKKYGRRFRVEGELYDFQPTGLEFAQAPRLTLPTPQRVWGGEKLIGAWKRTELRWVSLETDAAGGSALMAMLSRLHQVAVLLENQPLGIKELSFLPSPFSPSQGPLRIGYVLSSLQGRAFVTIRIYNMAGVLVRTIADHEPQYTGAHTEHAIAWDGQTASGRMARNGRYLVEVVAEDSDGKERALGTVVLVW